MWAPARAMLGRMADAGERAGEVEVRRGTPLARGADASVTVYAAVTGLAGAIPLPLVDGLMSELARGAAMRRVARRHGVTLTPGARAILAGSGTVRATSSERGRLLKAAVATVLAPFRVAARLEDAAGTMFAALVLDHFLRRIDRPKGATLTEAEARRVRVATEAAIAEAGFDVLRTVPVGVWTVFRRALDAVMDGDDEGRSAVERFVDALLDGLADAPNELTDSLVHHFDVALARDGEAG